MVTGHSITMWQTLVAWGWMLELRCSCGWTAERLHDYDEAEVMATDHRDEQQRLLELEQDEAAHQ